MYSKVLCVLLTALTITGCNQSVEMNEGYIYQGQGNDYYPNKVYENEQHHHEHHQEHHHHGHQNRGHEGHGGSSHHGH